MGQKALRQSGDRISLYHRLKWDGRDGTHNHIIPSANTTTSKNLCPFLLPFISHIATRIVFWKQKSDDVIHLLKSLGWHYTISRTNPTSWHYTCGLLSPSDWGQSFGVLPIWTASYVPHAHTFTRNSHSQNKWWLLLSLRFAACFWCSWGLAELGPTPFELILHKPAWVFLKGNFTTSPHSLFILSCDPRAWFTYLYFDMHYISLKWFNYSCLSQLKNKFQRNVSCFIFAPSILSFKINYFIEI